MPLLQLRDVTKAYGGIIAVNGASFDVAEGEITALIGPNGAGKTTAFDTISGVVVPDSGAITFDGEDITGLMSHVITKHGLGRTFQITRELSDMTVLENMVVSTISNDLGSLLRSRIAADERDRAMELLAFVGIERLADEPAKSLSYGQRKLLEFAAVLMTEPRLILLDEPAGGVNPALLERIMDRIEEINRKGVSFLIVEHNMDVVMRLSHSVVVMAHGQVILQDTPQVVREDHRVLDAYLGDV
ncbi:MAG: ATP-binding cassette domain-containing protein [Actinobacteria bacterium]|nr:ATP-binding cassette domain-containing protein [Actinomycetota bacterium]